MLKSSFVCSHCRGSLPSLQAFYRCPRIFCPHCERTLKDRYRKPEAKVEIKWTRREEVGR